MRIQLRAPGLALSACRSLPRVPSPTDPADGCCDPNPELHGRSPGWEARQRRVDHPVPQILAVGPCHARPPSNTGRATRILRLKQEPPPDSEKTERALAFTCSAEAVAVDVLERTQMLSCWANLHLNVHRSCDVLGNTAAVWSRAGYTFGGLFWSG
jgi:hypothetical protein